MLIYIIFTCSINPQDSTIKNDKFSDRNEFDISYLLDQTKITNMDWTRYSVNRWSPKNVYRSYQMKNEIELRRH